MGSSRLYHTASTWLRVTAVGWLLTVSATTTLNIFTDGLTPVGTYLLPLMLMALTLLISGQSLSCDGKSYAGAFAAALLVVALVAAVPDPLGSATARTLIYLTVSVIVMLLFIHGGLEIGRAPVWGSVQVLAPVTAILWGLASSYGDSAVQAIVGSSLPALLVTATASAAVFSVVFEVLTGAPVPAES